MPHVRPLRLTAHLLLLSCIGCAAPSLGHGPEGGDRPLVTVAEPGVIASADAAGSGFYLRVDAGLGAVLDTEVERTDASGASNLGDAAFDSGWMTGTALGYRFSDRWSADLEFTYRTNDVDRIRPVGATGLDAASGDFASGALMANVRYHFPSESRLRPYVGLGAGLVEEIDIDVDLAGVENSYSDSGFGVQAMLGVEYALDDSWSLSGEARYFRALDFEGSGEGPSAGGRASADYDHFGVLLGLTYRF
ncbi:MAG: outer membrane beta-barrel protein [Planctomycetota bacterium]|nr:outer membrane beta-barrel protein [Planctomycetota bacterium]MDA0934717.1 outer membrane beta-barrel protein [Planctomycetota bacterium]MDA1221203.1 outer membrane beta-barrel protein [Planctomycetota bacterium]